MSRGGVEGELVVVAVHQGVGEGAQGVRIRGPKGGDLAAGEHVFGHGEAQRGLAEGGRRVVLVEDCHLDLREERALG